jgi:hypothetical protein
MAKIFICYRREDREKGGHPIILTFEQESCQIIYG